VVATNHCDIPNIIQDGQSGFLVPERDAGALAGRLECLIKQPELWPEMGWAGRKFVEEHHDIKKLGRRLVKIYEALSAGRAKHLGMSDRVRLRKALSHCSILLDVFSNVVTNARGWM